MSLSATFQTARSSLAISSAMSSVTSRNIAGANEADYSQKRVVVTTGSNGLRQVGIERSADEAVKRNLLDATARASAADQVSRAYNGVASLLQVGSEGSSLVGRIGDLEAAFQTATADPRSLVGLQGVVDTASRLASALNASHEGLRQIQREADQTIAASVSKINQLLGEFAEIQNMVAKDRVAGVDLSVLEDRRDVILSGLSAEVGIAKVVAVDGSISIYASGGAVLFNGSPRSVQFTPTLNFEAGTQGAVVLIDGVNVTGPGSSMSVLSGKLAGAIKARDVIVPQALFQLDQISRGLVFAFSEVATNSNPPPPRLAGLFSFSQDFTLTGADPVPDASKSIKVNVNVDPAHGGLLTRLRDGGISAPGDDRYLKNPGGSVDFAGGLIDQLAVFSRPQIVEAELGLGSNISVVELSKAIISRVAAQVVDSENIATQASVTADGFGTFLSNSTGVNLDDELARLLQIENSYRATTKIISAVDSLYQSLFDAVR